MYIETRLCWSQSTNTLEYFGKLPPSNYLVYLGKHLIVSVYVNLQYMIALEAFFFLLFSILTGRGPFSQFGSVLVFLLWGISRRIWIFHNCLQLHAASHQHPTQHLSGPSSPLQLLPVADRHNFIQNLPLPGRLRPNFRISTPGVQALSSIHQEWLFLSVFIHRFIASAFPPELSVAVYTQWQLQLLLCYHTGFEFLAGNAVAIKLEIGVVMDPDKARRGDTRGSELERVIKKRVCINLTIIGEKNRYRTVEMLSLIE